MPEHPAPDEFDAFVSYKRTDIAFARKLEAALKGYRPPRTLAVPQRPLRVFRDEGDLSGTDYYASIDRALRKSRKLIVVCTPAAAQSPYVDDEVRRFVGHRGAEHLIAVLLAGTPNNETTEATAAERAFPPALCAAVQMPLAIAYRGFDAKREKVDRGAFEGSWYTLLANLYDLSRDEIEQRDRVRRRRQRNIVIGTTSTLMVGFAALAALAWWQKLQADDQRNAALRGLSRSVAGASGEVRASRPQRALLLAVEAVRVTRDAGIGVTPAARAALRSALETAGGRPPGGQLAFRGGRFSADGSRLAAVGEGQAWVWSLQDAAQPPRSLPLPEPAPTASSIPDDGVAQHAYSADGRWMALRMRQAGEVLLWRVDAPAGEPPARLPGAGAKSQVLAFSPDARWLAAADDGSGVLVWSLDAPRSDPRRLLPPRAADEARRPGPVTQAVFDPRSQWLATAGAGGAAWIWPLATPDAPPQALPAPVSAAVALRFSADGGWLVGAARARDDPRDPLAWRLEAGLWREVALTDAPAAPVWTDAPTRWGEPDPLAGPHGAARRLAVTGADGIRLWTLDGAAPRPARLPGYIAALSADGEWLAVVELDDAIRTSHALRIVRAAEPAGRGVRLGSFEQRVADLQFTPDGRQLIARTETGALWRTQVDLELPLHEPLPGSDTPLQTTTLSPDGRWLLAEAGWPPEARPRLWSLATLGTDPVRLRGVPEEIELQVRTSSGGGGGEPPDGLPGALAIDAASRHVLFPAAGGEVLMADLNAPEAAPRRLGAPGRSATASAFDPTGRWASSAGWNHAVRLWPVDPAASLPPRTLGEPDAEIGSSVSALALSPSGDRAATGGADGTVRLWSLQAADGAPRDLEGPEGWTVSLAFSPDGGALTALDEGGKLMTWDLGSAASAPARAWKAHATAAYAGYLADGRRIVSTGSGPAMAIWEPGPPASAVPPPGAAPERITTSALDAGRRWLAAGHPQGGVLLWDLNAPAAVALRIGRYTPAPELVSISPDGLWIAAADRARRIRIWSRTDPGGEPEVVAGPLGETSSKVRAAPWALRFSPDSRWLVGLAGGEARLWRLRLDDLLALACASAGRNLGADEWTSHLDGMPYRATCPEHGVPPGLRREARDWAVQGDLERSAALYEMIARIEPAATPPRTLAVEAAADAHAQQARGRARDGRIGEARAELRLLADLMPAREAAAAAEVDRILRAWQMRAAALRDATPQSLDATIAALREARSLDPAAIDDAAEMAGQKIGPLLVEQGDAAAQAGRLDEAVAAYARADGLGIDIGALPEARARTRRAHAVAEAAREAGERGAVDAALEGYLQAHRLDAEVVPDPEAAVRPYRARALGAAAEAAAIERRYADAAALHGQARRLDPRAASPYWLNDACWGAATQDQARLVLELCDQAVAADPESGAVRDSRGVARALSGDLRGAIGDFEAYLAWAEGQRDAAEIEQRRRWVARLRAGARPASYAQLEAWGRR